MGELFPGKKLNNEESGDSNGQEERPRLELDLDSGVVRLSPRGAGTEQGE